MQIYIAEGTQQTGPFDLETIKAGLTTGKYQPTQLAWYEGAPGWEPINKLPGMETFAAPPPPPPPPAPPAPPPYPMAPPPYSPAPPPYSSAPPTAYAPGSVPPPAYAPPPPSFVPVQTAPYVPGTSAPPKKGIMATLGGLFVGLLAVLFGLAKIARIFLPHNSYSTSHSYSSTPAPSSTSPSAFWSPASSPSLVGTATYRNAANSFTGERLTYFVPFQFSYPLNWNVVTGAKVEHQEDFVELENKALSQTLESFYVEGFHSTGNGSAADVLPTFGPEYTSEFEGGLKKDYPDFHRVSQGMTKLKNYTAFDYRGQGTAKFENKSVQLVVRYLLVAPPTGKNGVILEMIANTTAPDIKGVNDLGAKGGTATVLQSFTFN